MAQRSHGDRRPEGGDRKAARGLPAERTLPADAGDVGGHRDPRPALVLAGGGDRRHAAVAADGADPRARFRACDRRFRLDAAIGQVIVRRFTDVGAVLCADRFSLAIADCH